MKTTKRFDRAVTKLYNAFHNGELSAYDCTKCAVGNMCDNSSDWSSLRFCLGGDLKVYAPQHAYIAIEQTGYSDKEILHIENTFMSCFSGPDTEHSKQHQFEGLEAVVKYLCELDGIDNVMEYTKIFDYNEKGAINQLTQAL